MHIARARSRGNTQSRGGQNELVSEETRLLRAWKRWPRPALCLWCGGHVRVNVDETNAFARSFHYTTELGLRAGMWLASLW